MSDNVLVISPHPDDLEIGMGGTVAKFTESGVNVVSMVVTDGRRSTSLYGLSEDEMAELRGYEVRNATAVLGIGYLILVGLGDVRSGENKSSFASALEDAMGRFSPREIYIPHPEIDKHPTHRAVSSIALDTLREMDSGLLPEGLRVWCYEVWTPFPSYDRIEDVSLQMHVKQAAIDAHKSQLEYKNYTDGITGLNRYRAVFNETGGLTIMEYAEIFLEVKI
jgi:LmbE family N-acetylglucosaminyl deacetylase